MTSNRWFTLLWEACSAKELITAFSSTVKIKYLHQWECFTLGNALKIHELHLPAGPLAFCWQFISHKTKIKLGSPMALLVWLFFFVLWIKDWDINKEIKHEFAVNSLSCNIQDQSLQQRWWLFLVIVLLSTLQKVICWKLQRPTFLYFCSLVWIFKRCLNNKVFPSTFFFYF